MRSSTDELSQFESVEVTAQQKTQICPTSKISADHLCSSENVSNAMAFLKRNAFVLLTIISVVLGKWFS